MTRVLVCSPNPTVSINIEAFLIAADVECETEADPQAFGSLLFREQASIGIFVAPNARCAADMAMKWRLGDIRNPLFALVDEQTIEDDAPGRAIILNAGADDAQPWPILGPELVSRLFALERRQRDGNPALIQLPGCVLRPSTGELIGDTARVHLTGLETVLLTALAHRPGAVVTKAMCMLALYNGRDEAHIKIVDVLVCKIRKKIAAATGGLDCIETIWGQGFRFNAEGYEPSFSPFGHRVPG